MFCAVLSAWLVAETVWGEFVVELPPAEGLLLLLISAEPTAATAPIAAPHGMDLPFLTA